MDYSLKANPNASLELFILTAISSSSISRPRSRLFWRAGLPIISVNTKKKELIGNFKNGGRNWCLQVEEVNDHDFDQDALEKAVPYGIYDLNHNLGYVYVGHSADTPQFAADVIALCEP